MAKTSQANQGAAPEWSFDQRIERLEALVRELEQGQIGLEDAIARYQEGTELVRRCREQLDLYQRRVEELTEAGSKPYAGDPDAKG
ncbi:MAG: exodeoxyribonuclease VII small subunit [Planctomycetes bacterium]|nr:exodeoxyribonuclease VII small subunit [Planctomycetota bacterium]